MNLSESLRKALGGAPHLSFGGESPVRAGDEKLASHELGCGGKPRLVVSSDAFTDGGWIPPRFAADHDNDRPPLRWEGVPADVRSFAIVCEDADAPPPKPFVHWLVCDIPAEVRRITLGTQPFAMCEGKSSSLQVGYTGCAPPKGDIPHRYHFQVFALDQCLALKEPGRDELLEAMKGHVIAYGDLVGIYQR